MLLRERLASRDTGQVGTVTREEVLDCIKFLESTTSAPKPFPDNVVCRCLALLLRERLVSQGGLQPVGVDLYSLVTHEDMQESIMALEQDTTRSDRNSLLVLHKEKCAEKHQPGLRRSVVAQRRADYEDDCGDEEPFDSIPLGPLRESDFRR